MAASDGISIEPAAVEVVKVIVSPELATMRQSMEEGRGIETQQQPPIQSELQITLPHDWPKGRKWSILLVVALYSLMVAISLVIVAPAGNVISEEFHNQSGFLSVFFITVPNLGQVLGAFYVGPLSERFGRVPILHVFNVLWLVFTLAGGFSTSISQITVFRFFTGACISSINLNPAVAGDLFLPQQRGFALSIASLIPLAGSALGPLLGGYITQYLSWRWTFFTVAISTGALIPISFFTLKETYVPILWKRALKAQGVTHSQDSRSGVFGNNVLAATKTLHLLVFRPFVILSSSWLAVGMGLYLAICFGYLSVLNSTNATVFQDVYGFSDGSSGLIYLSTTAGTLIASLYCSFTLDYFLVRGLPHKKQDPRLSLRPENRLIAVIPALVVFPIGLLVYGWTVQNRVHFIVPILATFLYGFSLSSATVPIMAYIVDIFGDRSASAIGAILPLRYLVGALLPIATPYMYARLGYGWSNTLLALILIALAPIVLWAIVRSPQNRTPEDAEDASASSSELQAQDCVVKESSLLAAKIIFTAILRPSSP
ncbi:hypothetical protein O1611_g9778 [Lasiodiplodia mahajangana]|uniref:Uncharacterized protein n=1 Tax=Lasiodiplodia mahajangana TaxID=1108764 RepID=A0ACC2J5G9_9PEZI|nr:hypothetical protein O1611_g9778 [Lasiodiplodia mahajangana]